MKRGALILLIITVACSGGHVHDELPVIVVTEWTDRLELFMEFETLVTNRETRFAVHLTDLRTFEPLAVTGAPVLELEKGNEPILHYEAPTPSHPGIFRVVASVPEAGSYQMRLRVGEPNDVFELGEVHVFEDEHEAAHAGGEEAESEPTIAYLKEQQWVTEFRTELVAKRSLHQSVRISAEVRPRTGGGARVISPVSGRLVIEGTLPPPGSRVRRGQILARIAPRASQVEDYASLEMAVAVSKADLDQAQRNRRRLENLIEAKAVPARRLEEAKRDEAVAIAQHEAAQKRLAQIEETLRSGGGGRDDTFVNLTAPLSGVLISSEATPGEAVEEGQELFQIVDPSVVYVVGAIPETVIPRFVETMGVELMIPGRDGSVSLTGDRGSQISMGASVDPTSRTVPVVYQVRNDDGLLLVGQAVSLRLITEEVTSTISVPASALVNEGGREVAYVHVGGESFARRPLVVGLRDRDYVQILAGLQEGERVVTRGAYEVRLASLSGQVPAEGHVH